MTIRDFFLWIKFTKHISKATFIYSNISANFVSEWIHKTKMYFIEKTTEFDKWLRKLKDFRAKAKILFRIQKLENEEHFGDCKPVGDGISELKINYAKGYRIYFKETDGKIIILLIGGDKSTQQKDIEKAKAIWDKLKK